MSLIAEQIDAIIEKRKSKVKQIDEASEKLKKCSRGIDRLRCIQSDINSGNGRFASLFKDPEIVAKVGSISLKRFDELSIEYADELNRLKKRFGREQLHISFVGRMRQGKSTLIQTISGLDADVIPSSNGTACTGAKSLITNSGTDKVDAEITFYSETEMINIINDYLRNICHSSEYCISLLSQLRDIPIDKIKENIPDGYADESILFEKLRNYYVHSDEIIENCKKGRITVPKEDIEKYVAQYSHKNRDEKYYNFLSVKTADIHCHFPFEDAGKIKLLDTIGLEDNLLNVDEDMFNTIKNDSDAIIYMRLPAETGADVDRPDVTVISDIAKKVSPGYAREMLFWVVNNKPGINDDQCKAYINKIDKNKFAVSDVIKANCSSKDDVETHLLMPILDILYVLNSLK